MTDMVNMEKPAIFGKILLIDDTPQNLDILVSLLHNDGFEVATAINGAMALDAVARIAPDLILLDIMMDGVDGYEICKQIKADKQLVEIPVIFISALVTTSDKLKAFSVGGVDYISKPFHAEEILARVHIHLALCRAHKEVKRQKEQLEQEKFAREKTEQQLHRYQQQLSGLLTRKLLHPEIFSGFITKNEKMFSIFQYIEALACSEEPVQIIGESGVGKELIAKAVHQVCCPAEPLIAFNIAGLDDVQFSDTLFGHVKGAFTGADNDRTGMIARAGCGTLFFDEIGDLGLDSQVKLLRLLQEKEYRPLGSDIVCKMDARIVVASNANLKQKVADKQFRRDLYYRISVHCIEIPPLRERKEDIPLLLDHYLTKAADKFNKKKPSYPQELPLLLHNYKFPGNIRELRALVFDAMSQHNSRMLSMDVFNSVLSPEKNISVEQSALSGQQVIFTDELPTIKGVAALLIEEALKRTQGNQSMAAKLVGVTPSALSLRLKKKSK